MCTSMTYKTSDGQYWLARTMDFGFELGGNPIVVPRQYEFHGVLGETFTTKFGFVGTGTPVSYTHLTLPTKRIV